MSLKQPGVSRLGPSSRRGAEVQLKENQVNLDIAVVMQYGCKIHEAARDMQNRIRTAVEEMSGLEVLNVNVSVLGININKEANKVEVIDDLQP
jgi:uncharacterized alkaline shock family protein YloU